MGKPAQKRLIRRLDLELFLSKVAPHPSPQACLEQYTISESVAATMLYLSAYARCDIVGKTVLDLACGTGRLALGAAFLGARDVVGVDSDRTAIKTACQNSEIAGLRNPVQWVTCDLDAVIGRFDTVLQNPPFGVQNRMADRKFLKKALEVGNSIYSLHNHPAVNKHLTTLLEKSSENMIQVPPSSFIEAFVEKHGGTVRSVYALPMTIPKTFGFHTRRKYQIVVDLYVIEKIV